MPKLEATCVQCGTAFRYYPSAQSGRYCSNSCSLRHSPRKPRRGREVTCVVCGKTAYRNASEQAKGARYCSSECHNVAQAKAPVVKACAACGAEMRLKPSQAGRVYCTKVCEATGRTKRPLARQHNGKPARLDSAGYVMVYEPTHPNTSFKGWQYEHRLVAEAVLGRYLTSDEAVHHLNGVKDDNRPENLEVMNALEHASLSVADYRDAISRALAELAEYRRLYGPLPEKE